MKKFFIAGVLGIIIILIGIGVILGNMKKDEGPKDDWDYIKSKGELIIGMQYLAPINYIDNNGKHVGFDKDFAEALTKKLGIKAVFQEVDWDAKEIELNAKNIDCIWNATGITEERAKNMDFSIPYINNAKVVVTRIEDKDKYNSKQDFAGAIIAVNQGSISEKIARTYDLFSLANIVVVDVQSKSFMEVATKTADLTIVDYVTSTGYFIEKSNFNNLAIARELKEEEYVCGIAFRKGSPETVRVVNKAIEELKADGTLKAIFEKYDLADILL